MSEATTRPQFAPWEVGDAYLWVSFAGVAHICDSIIREHESGRYQARTACRKARRDFYHVTFTTGFYVRNGLKWPRCRECVAETRKRFAEVAKQ